MGQNHVFIKEVIMPEGKRKSAYTTLTGLLKSEGLYHIYYLMRYALLADINNKSEGVRINNILIKRINKPTELKYVVEYEGEYLFINQQKHKR